VSCSSLILRHDSNDGRLVKERKTEPLNIQVVDPETNEPLTGITVYYQLEKRGMHISLLNPEGHITSKYTTVERLKLITDKNGEVTVPVKPYVLLKNEGLYSMSFYINLDTDKKRIPSSKDFRNFRDLIKLSAENDQNISGDKIIFIDKGYYTTAVYIINERRGLYQGDTTRLGPRYNFYELYRPFSETEQLIVWLVRNRG
jgi:hypothetical protein